MGGIDSRKSYAWVPHSQFIRFVNMFGVTMNIVKQYNQLEDAMDIERQETYQCTNQKCHVQGDSPSTSLF